MSLPRIFAVFSLIALMILWLITLLAIPMSAEQYTVITGQYPLFPWIVYMSIFAGATAVLSLAIIIHLTGRIDGLEGLITKILLPPSEPEAEQIKRS